MLRVKQGQNYGFPNCTWTKAKARACRKDTKPFQTFASHMDPMGLGIVGQRLFISEFGGSTHPRVISIPLAGGKPRIELSGFSSVQNIVGLGVHHGWVYAAQIASSPTDLGTIYRFKP